MAERPGVMFYFDSLNPALKRLDDSQLGALLRAVIVYAQTGEMPELDDLAGFAFDSLRPKIDRDGEKYQEQCLKSSYAAYCREAKKQGIQPLQFDQWLSCDTGRYPTTAAIPSAKTIVAPAAKEAAEGSPGGDTPPEGWNTKRNRALELVEGYNG